MLIALLLLSSLASDSGQAQERTIFQTAGPYSDQVNIRADVAVVYGFNNDFAGRAKGWRDHGYRIHFMTGVAWGEYQDYLYGRWDGINHEDEVQQRKNGEKIGHGGDVYYMSPGKNYGKYLCVGVQKALDGGAEAIDLEEPEFWVAGGYAEGFKREWQDYYHEAWQPPDSSPDARWRASKLMYFLYRRALQQVFDYVQAYNAKTGKHIRCYVPTHSLLNYAHWHIVSPESSLAHLNGCDGYIAQVWTGTARTWNVFRGKTGERTFDTAFLEYGAMQNIVRATGRRVWYLADPVEDDPNHDWGDYKRNYEATLTASLLQPEVWRYEVLPWPDRIFKDKYPSAADPKVKTLIPPGYGTELQVVMNALKDMNQPQLHWDCGSQGIGFLVSDSLMFERGNPTPSDGDMSHIYGLALPLVERGIPVQPVQLENVTLPETLRPFRTLLMTYEGMKPLSPEVHDALARWVKGGGRLIFVDDDRDPYAGVREWWNSDGLHYKTPRLDLFSRLGIADWPGWQSVGRGGVAYLRQSPSALAHDPHGDSVVAETVRQFGGTPYREASAIVLHRGPFAIAAGVEGSEAQPTKIPGRWLDLFDANLAARLNPTIQPGSHEFFLDLDHAPGPLLASAGQVTDVVSRADTWTGQVAGLAGIPAILAFRFPRPPFSVMVDGVAVDTWDFDSVTHVLRVKFPGSAAPQRVTLKFGSPKK